MNSPVLNGNVLHVNGFGDIHVESDIESFMFTSESVGEGHPGKSIIIYFLLNH